MMEPILLGIEPRGWRECIVAATGPSLTEEVADAVAAYQRTAHVIAVNDAYRRLPFADLLYAGDRDWWDLHEGCPDFQGEKWIAHEPKHNNNLDVAAKYGLALVGGPRAIDAPGFSLDPKRIHYGNCSGFQAINLAILFGASPIMLVGFDMRTPTPGSGHPRHFFGDHAIPSMNLSTYEHFHQSFIVAARMLPPHIRIVNCTPGSALRCFPSMPLEAAVAA